MRFKTVAVIPARGGSKRIPRKNIKEFLGQPIIKYSIDSALESGCFSEVMVSTDDEEIAEIARISGASIPFLRSAETSHDFAITMDVLKEVIIEYQKIGKEFDSLCCLFPTAVFITAERIKQAMEIFEKHDPDCVLPVARFSYPIQRALKVIDGHLKMIWPEHYPTRSQDLEPAFHDAGQFFFTKVPSLFESKLDYSGRTLPLEISEQEVHDIDTLEDWKIAEMKYKHLKELNEKN